MSEVDYELHLDRLTVEEIYEMIDCGALTREEVVDYYNNEWWDEEVA